MGNNNVMECIDTVVIYLSLCHINLTKTPGPDSELFIQWATEETNIKWYHWLVNIVEIQYE